MRYCFKVSADYDVRNDTLMPADKFRKIAAGAGCPAKKLKLRFPRTNISQRCPGLCLGRARGNPDIGRGNQKDDFCLYPVILVDNIGKGNFVFLFIFIHFGVGIADIHR